MLLFPEPLGPTMAVMPSPNVKVLLSAKLLNPTSSSCLSMKPPGRSRDPYPNTISDRWPVVRNPKPCRVGRVFETHREAANGKGFRWVSKTRPTLQNLSRAKKDRGSRSEMALLNIDRRGLASLRKSFPFSFSFSLLLLMRARVYLRKFGSFPPSARVCTETSSGKVRKQTGQDRQWYSSALLSS